jgi:hypothetical protein
MTSLPQHVPTYTFPNSHHKMHEHCVAAFFDFSPAVPFGSKSRVPGFVRSTPRRMHIKNLDRVCPKKWHTNFGPAVPWVKYDRDWLCVTKPHSVPVIFEFKYDRDWLCVNKPHSFPFIFEPPSNMYSTLLMHTPARYVALFCCIF